MQILGNLERHPLHCYCSNDEEMIRTHGMRMDQRSPFAYGRPGMGEHLQASLEILERVGVDVHTQQIRFSLIAFTEV